MPVGNKRLYIFKQTCNFQQVCLSKYDHLLSTGIKGSMVQSGQNFYHNSFFCIIHFGFSIIEPTSFPYVQLCLQICLLTRICFPLIQKQPPEGVYKKVLQQVLQLAEMSINILFFDLYGPISQFLFTEEILIGNHKKRYKSQGCRELII